VLNTKLQEWSILVILNKFDFARPLAKTKNIPTHMASLAVFVAGVY
jgi:hypothetical protein